MFPGPISPNPATIRYYKDVGGGFAPNSKIPIITANGEYAWKWTDDNSWLFIHPNIDGTVHLNFDPGSLYRGQLDFTPASATTLFLEFANLQDAEEPFASYRPQDVPPPGTWQLVYAGMGVANYGLRFIGGGDTVAFNFTIEVYTPPILPVVLTPATVEIHAYPPVLAPTALDVATYTTNLSADLKFTSTGLTSRSCNLVGGSSFNLTTIPHETLPAQGKITADAILYNPVGGPAIPYQGFIATQPGEWTLVSQQEFVDTLYEAANPSLPTFTASINFYIPTPIPPIPPRKAFWGDSDNSFQLPP